jgi:two-component system cell cycle sensor histidine kinase/response regulator CckA
MSKTLRVLNIEDSELDAELLRNHLSSTDYDLLFNRVDTSEALKIALETQAWDVILSDYSLPQFNALEALALLKETGLDIPFIIISGTVGESVAVEAMRAGAQDYLMKGNLMRLVPTLERELQEAENRCVRRQAEAALKNSEERFRALTEKTSDLTAILNVNATVHYVSPSLFRMLGYTVEEWLGRQVFEFIHPDDIQPVIEALELGIRHQDTGLPLELRVHHKNGSWRLMEARDTNLLENEAVAGIVINARDITERKQAEETSRESEERLRTVIENLSEGLIISDLDGQLLHWNRAGIEMHGFRSLDEGLLHLPEFEKIFELSTPDGDILNFNEWPLPRIIRGEPVRNLELRIRRFNTDWERIYIYGGGIVREPGGKLLAFLTITDITERKILEEQFRQSQKMEAVGRLAGGIAHDFNNLLTAITGYSQLTLRRLSAEDPLRSNIEEIKKAGDRAASLTRQLLAFSRKQVLQPKVLDINSVVSDMEKMLHRLLGEDIELRIVLASELGTIKADPGQIEQVIMNLAVNARDAMPDGGKLTIETENVFISEEYVKHPTTVRSGHYAILAVSDIGIGMDEQMQAHIFDPFFTTKELGKGTGLGLSTVYGIVKQSGGHIEVYSEVGRGTTFKVYFPLVDEGTKEYKRSIESKESPQGTETVLLAEDDEILRRLICMVLKGNGYQVLEAANGSAALLACKSHQEPIHLLLTDVIMPEMNGRQLVDRLTPVRPEMKVLFMSGYTDDAIVHQGVLADGVNFIQKPFPPSALAHKVREVLDAP